MKKFLVVFALALAACSQHEDLPPMLPIIEAPAPDNLVVTTPDDIVFDFIHAQECIRNDACDVISLYPGKNGGIRKTKRIVDYCARHALPTGISPK